MLSELIFPKITEALIRVMLLEEMDPFIVEAAICVIFEAAILPEIDVPLT